MHKALVPVFVILLCVVSLRADTAPQKHIHITVTDQFPKTLSVKTTQDVHRGQLLRIKASGTQLLRKALIAQAVVDGTPLEAVQTYSKSKMGKDWTWYIKTMSMATYRMDRDIPSGTEIKLKMVSDQSSQKAVNTYSGLSWSLQTGVVDDERSEIFKPVSETLVMDFVAGPPTQIKAYLKSGGRLCISYLDQFGNPADAGQREIVLAFGDERIKAAKPAGLEVLEINVPADVDRVKVRDNLDLETLSTGRQTGIDGTPLWFGEFHWHTEFSSDGQRPMKDAMHSAKYELALDFAGPSDHATVKGVYQRGIPEEQKAICEPFEEPGRFAIVAGAERSCVYGHANIYAENFDNFVNLMKEINEVYIDFDWNSYPHEKTAELCKQYNAIYIPHHSNMDSWVSEGVVQKNGLPVWCAMPFPERPSDTIVETMRLFEIHQHRGTFESEDLQPEWETHFGGLGGSAQTALKRGYRTGFVAATDNHCGWPTRGATKTEGITGVYSDTLDQKSIFNALKNRRCYAATGERIIADAMLNGKPMGSVVPIAIGQPRTFEIMIKGTAPIEKVQIISLGQVLANLPVEEESLDFRTTWQDDRPGRPLEYVYYYVRARQADGSCVWLSPWWIERAKNK